MLRNLHGVYAEKNEWDRAARSADRVLRLMPGQSEALRDRGLAYLELDHLRGARQDLARYLELVGEDHLSLPMRLDRLGPTVVDWFERTPTSGGACPQPLAPGKA